MVYVISMDEKPLMPTTNAKARILLKEKKATVKRLRPFTIQLTYETKTTYVQKTTLGIDSGYLNIGFSVVDEQKELISGEVKLLQGMKERLIEKSSYRRNRRQRLRYRKARFDNRNVDEQKELISGEVKLLQGMKERLIEKSSYRRNRRQRLRYRKARFDNRKNSKPKGWLAPSLQHKLNTHVKFINFLHSLLPIHQTIVEVANFDIQKMKDDLISGKGYQEGDMLGFWNVREYVLHRDGHKCQNPNCKNKSKNPVLMVHHLVYRSEGGTDRPENLATLCDKCHTPANHKKGKFLYDWMVQGKQMKGFKDATFMSMIHWMLINGLREMYPNINFTYGYLTKNKRIEQGIEKSHRNDAFVIANGTTQKRDSQPSLITQSRLKDRSLEKFYDAKYIDTRTGEKVSASDLPCGRSTRKRL